MRLRPHRPTLSEKANLRNSEEGRGAWPATRPCLMAWPSLSRSLLICAPCYAPINPAAPSVSLAGGLLCCSLRVFLPGGELYSTPAVNTAARIKHMLFLRYSFPRLAGSDVLAVWAAGNCGGLSRGLRSCCLLCAEDAFCRPRPDGSVLPVSPIPSTLVAAFHNPPLHPGCTTTHTPTPTTHCLWDRSLCLDPGLGLDLYNLHHLFFCPYSLLPYYIILSVVY